MPRPDHPPAFLFYPDDFCSDSRVEVMTTEEVGAYMLLLCKSWRESPPGSIPNDDVVLARWARLTSDRWAECRTGVLAAFKFGTDSRWHQKRLRREYDSFLARRKAKKEAGKKGAEARYSQRDTWQPHSSAIAEPCLSVPSSVPIPKREFKTNPAPVALLLPDWLPRTQWEAFRKMRAEINRPLNDKKAARLLNGLSKLRDAGHDPGKVLEQSTDNCWQGLFELRGGGNAARGATGSAGSDLGRRAIASAIRSVRALPR